MSSAETVERRVEIVCCGTGWMQLRDLETSRTLTVPTAGIALAPAHDVPTQHICTLPRAAAEKMVLA
jgi:hypothetical protein